jgi:hypothetical protein
MNNTTNSYLKHIPKERINVNKCHALFLISYVYVKA